MSENFCRQCPFYSRRASGEIQGERLYKFHARMTERGQIVGCLRNLHYAQASFIEYSRDENGAIDGAVIRCDLGHGYGFDDGDEDIVLHPHETHRFTHSYTDTSEGTWDDDFFTVTLTLIPFDEEECCWKGI